MAVRVGERFVSRWIRCGHCPDGALKSATIHSKLGKPCRAVRRSGIGSPNRSGKDYVFDGELRPAKIIPAKPCRRGGRADHGADDEAKNAVQNIGVCSGGRRVRRVSRGLSGAHWSMWRSPTQSATRRFSSAWSDDLLHWKKSGNILPFRRSGWDAWQGDAELRWRTVIGTARTNWNGCARRRATKLIRSPLDGRGRDILPRLASL